MASQQPPHVLVVDGEPSIRALIREVLEEAGYRVSVAAEAPSNPSDIGRSGADLVVLDPGHGSDGLGWRLLRTMERDGHAAAIPVVVCSGATKVVRNAAADLEERGYGFVPKPFDIDDLLRAVADRLGELPATR